MNTINEVLSVSEAIEALGRSIEARLAPIEAELHARELQSDARELLSIPEALHALGDMSKTTLYQKVRAGHLSIVKIGRRTYVELDEIRRYVASLQAENSNQVEEATR